MDTVIFDVATLPDFLRRARTTAQSGQPAHAARISFASPQRLLYVLSDKRLAVLQTMMGAGALDVPELARRLGRDAHAVDADIAVLLDAGVVDRTDQGKLLFPYRHVSVQFTLDDSHAPAMHPLVAQQTRSAVSGRMHTAT